MMERSLADLGTMFGFMPQEDNAMSLARLAATAERPSGLSLADLGKRLIQGATRLAMLPGDVYAGRTPMWGDDGRINPEVIERSADLAGLVMGGTFRAAPAGAVGSSGARRGLPMDEASRMARAKQLGYSDTPLYRGEVSGTLPSQYEAGAHFSRDKDYARGFAQRGGRDEPREFRLDLRNTYKDYEPVTADAYARLVAAADNPKLADELVGLIAEGKDAGWFAEFAKRNPNLPVTDRSGTAMLRQAIEKNSADPIGLFRRAGYDALDSGRDVRKLSGAGIRHKDAAFDPSKADLPDIFASIAGVGAAVPALFPGSGSYPSQQ